MEKFMKKLEEKFDKQMEAFEKSPIRTSIKWLIIIFVVKKIWNMIKEDEKKEETEKKD